jgi:hypothetical protein
MGETKLAVSIYIGRCQKCLTFIRILFIHDQLILDFSFLLDISYLVFVGGYIHYNIF